MSIFNTLWLVLKADSSNAQKGVKEVDDSTKKLDESTKKTDGNLNKIGDSFLGVAKSFGAMAASAVSVFALLHELHSATDYVVNLDLASRQLGINTEALDAWDNAVKRTGGSAEAFQGTLRSLSQHLGVSTGVALKLLPQFADTFQKLGRVRAIRYGEMLGIDQGTILLLQQGRREVEALLARQKELGLVSEKDAKIARVFNFELQDMSHAFRSLFIEIGGTVLPILTRIAGAFTDVALYFKKHADLIQGALIAVTAVVARFAIAFAIANIEILGITLAIGLAIAAFALLYEDIKYFIEGNDSLTGRLLKRWPQVGEAIKIFANAFRQNINMVKEALHGLISLVNLTVEGFEKIASFFGGNKKITAAIATGQSNLGVAGASLLGSQTSSSILNSRAFNSKSNSIQTGDIIINTQATDAYGIAGAFGRGLESQLNQSNSNFDDGLVA